MTAEENIQKAIKHFKCVRDGAVVVLDTGFGTHEGESDTLYRNRKMYAELAINALEKQIPKKPEFVADGYADGELVYDTWVCPSCGKHYEVDCDDYDFCPNCGKHIDWSEEE